ncbi:histidine--tRNA ligase [soil metagenome]
MSARFQASKGTFDILPEESRARARLYFAAAGAFERAGYGRIETPAFEDTELFSRGVGEATDIVRKEMFTFEDQGGRELTLRPEGTAPISRAYVEHGMHKLPQPVKLWYWGPFFRHERPQAGRFRQFHQVGAEAIGADSPLLDAETIILLDELLRAVGVAGVRLRLTSLGSPESRARYREELRGYLRGHEDKLSDDVRERIDLNPMRAFDSDHPGTKQVMSEAPTMLDRLEDSDAEHFEAVKRLRERAGVPFEVDPSLVRGLDYYSRTVFEFESQKLGAQAALGGGVRYDCLVAELGGPPTAAVGWAAGIERILLAAEAHDDGPGLDVYVVASDDQRERGLAIVTELRRAGLRADLDHAGRSNKGQMKKADRSGAPHAVVLDEEGGAILRGMQSGEQRELDLSRLREELDRGVDKPR